MALDPEPIRPWTVATQVDRKVIQLFAMVGDAIAGATLALLSGDREAGKILVERDADVDELYREIEQTVESHLVSGSDSPPRLRYLVTVLRILPELERSGDLAEHVARRAARGLASEMSARTRGLIERMGEVAVTLWRMASDAFGDRTPEVAERLDELDDEMDELLVSLTAELAASTMAMPVVIECTLLGRFYERLGDHAVNLTRRVPARIHS